MRKHRPARRKSRGTRMLMAVAALLLLLTVWLWLSREPRPHGQTAKPSSNVPPVPSPLVTEKTPPPAAQPSPPPAEQRPTPLPEPEPSRHEAPKPMPAVSEPLSALRPEPRPDVFPRPVRSVLEAQIALARQGISSGSVDGVMGTQTHNALAAFQQEQALPATGELDHFTRELLILASPPLTNYVVTSHDLSRLQPISPTWLGKSEQNALDYETLLELVSEEFHASPNFIRKLNPGVDWAATGAGATLTVPDTAMPIMRSEASFIRIFLSRRLLQVFDSNSNLVAHFPCSIAQKVEKRPAGELHVSAIAPNPNYTFDPAVFTESEEAKRIGHKLIIPPGPNNPVGVAWISLNKPGYGIHGTPQPEQVGRTESHGCFRLANWNATHLLQLVHIGMPVYVEN